MKNALDPVGIESSLVSSDITQDRLLFFPLSVMCGIELGP